MKFRKALSFAISYAIDIVYTKQAEKKTDVFQTFFGLLNNIEYMSDAIAGKSNIRVGAAAWLIARGSQIPRGKLGHGLVCSFAPLIDVQKKNVSDFKKEETSLLEGCTEKQRHFVMTVCHNIKEEFL